MFQPLVEPVVNNNILNWLLTQVAGDDSKLNFPANFSDLRPGHFELQRRINNSGRQDFVAFQSIFILNMKIMLITSGTLRLTTKLDDAVATALRKATGCGTASRRTQTCFAKWSNSL